MFGFGLVLGTLAGVALASEVSAVGAGYSFVKGWVVAKLGL